MAELRVLVCVKRVPDSSSQILLTEDAQAVDGRHVGFTISAHEEAALELGLQVVDAAGGTVTALTLGSREAADQLRNALALGARAAVHIEADATAFGPADVAREIAALVRAHEDAGTSYDLILLGNDAADSGDFQVGIRLAYALGRPVVNGASRVTVSEGELHARVDGPDGEESYALPLPAVATVLEGGVEPRYPTIKGRMAAKKIEIEKRSPTSEPEGARRVRLLLPPTPPSTVQVLGEGPDAAAAAVDLFEKLGVR